MRQVGDKQQTQKNTEKWRKLLHVSYFHLCFIYITQFHKSQNCLSRLCKPVHHATPSALKPLNWKKKKEKLTRMKNTFHNCKVCCFILTNLQNLLCGICCFFHFYCRGCGRKPLSCSVLSPRLSRPPVCPLCLFLRKEAYWIKVTLTCLSFSTFSSFAS